jgi:homoserine O-succinyltransferase
MPVLIDVEHSDHHLFSRTLPAMRASRPPPGGWIDVGLVNNMPDAALMSTERQVLELLGPASGNLAVRLRFYAMPSVPRSEWGRDYLRRHYRSADEMFDGRLDGIIVTGTEPKASRLTEEPYWQTFAEMTDWAAENTSSAIYSCLAVHGVVQYADGVERRALRDKCIGVFVQSRAAEHELMRGLPRIFRTPHARWNEVCRHDLADCGYSILSESTKAGADCFVKQRKRSLFVHFQGHPEYDAHSLLGEYRRDMGRFLRGESDVCPTVPAGYFDSESEELAAAFRRQALQERRSELFAAFPADRLVRDVRNVWRPAAGRIYRNWLSCLAERRVPRRPVAIAASSSSVRRARHRSGTTRLAPRGP